MAREISENDSRRAREDYGRVTSEDTTVEDEEYRRRVEQQQLEYERRLQEYYAKYGATQYAPAEATTQDTTYYNYQTYDTQSMQTRKSTSTTLTPATSEQYYYQWYETSQATSTQAYNYENAEQVNRDYNYYRENAGIDAVYHSMQPV